MSRKPKSESILLRELMREAALDSRFIGCDLRVLNLIQAHMRNGWCVRSQRKMALQLGVNRVTVMRSIARLEEFGYLAIEHRTGPDGGNASAAYRVRLPEDQNDLFGEGDPGVVDDSAPGNTGVTAPGNTHDSAPESSGDSTGTDSFQGRKRKKRVQRARIGPDQGQRDLLPAVVVPPSSPQTPVHDPPVGDLQPVPADWTPSETGRAFALQRGLTNEEVDEAAGRFVDHKLARGRGGHVANIEAAWRLWVRGHLELKAKREQGRRSGHGKRAHGRGATEAERLGSAFAVFREDDP